MNHKTIYKIHSWLGLFNAIWMIVLGITGSVLVYYKELDKAFNIEVLTVRPHGQKLAVDSLYKIARSKRPEATGTNILRFPDNPTDCISFRIYIKDGTKSITHWWDTYNMDLDPYTGKVLREGYYRDISKSFMHWSLNFHWSLNGGPIGEAFIAIVGLLLFLNIISGIIIYRKYFFKALIFKAPVKWNNWRTMSSGLHRYIGVWALIFNILIFYSGLQMNWAAFRKKAWTPPIEYPRNDQPYANIDSLISKAKSIYPGFELRYFYIPFCIRSINGANQERARAMGNIPGTSSLIPLSSSIITFDINTGELLEKTNANEEIKKKSIWGKFNFIAYSFHVGTFAGEFSRVLYILIGLTPALLSFTGFLLWWRRKKIDILILSKFEG